jgi:hypothetical protein
MTAARHLYRVRWRREGWPNSRTKVRLFQSYSEAAGLVRLLNRRAPMFSGWSEVEWVRLERADAAPVQWQEVETWAYPDVTYSPRKETA